MEKLVREIALHGALSFIVGAGGSATAIWLLAPAVERHHVIQRVSATCDVAALLDAAKRYREGVDNAPLNDVPYASCDDDVRGGYWFPPDDPDCLQEMANRLRRRRDEERARERALEECERALLGDELADGVGTLDFGDDIIMEDK